MSSTSQAHERIALHLAALCHDIAADRGCAPSDLSATLRHSLRERLLAFYKQMYGEIYAEAYAAGDRDAHERPTRPDLDPIG